MHRYARSTCSFLVAAALLAAAAPPARAEQLAPNPALPFTVVQARGAPARPGDTFELVAYAAITVLAPAVARANGVPWDPDHSFDFRNRVDHPIATLGLLRLNDKLAHGLGGAQVVVVSVALDPRTGHESCGRSALRALLRAQASSALWEVTESYTHRSQWGRPGFGLGVMDHLAVTAGSGLAVAGICALRRQP